MKIKIILSTILALGVLINLNAQSYPPDGWRVDVALVSATDVQQYSDIVAVGNSAHVIWTDNRDGNYKLYYKKSCDDGFNWSDERIISLPEESLIGEERNISITARGDNLYVVYSISTSSGYALRFCRSTDNGENWTGYQTIANSLTSFPQPSIAINGDMTPDSIRVVYCDEPDIVYVASGDNGDTWHSYDHLNFPDSPLLLYPAITTINNRPHIAIGANCMFVYARHLGSYWELFGWEMNPGESYHYARIVGKEMGKLCMIFEYHNIVGNDYRSIWRWYSTDGGNSWDGGVIWGPTSPWGPENPDVIIDKESRLLLVYGYYSNGNLFGCVSQDFGITWDAPFQLAGNYDSGPPEPPAFAPHPSIARGSTSKHIAFEKWGDNYDLFYIANDDLLLSDDNRATAFNNGRHLIRDPLTNTLHLVYSSQGRPHYTWSMDNGQTWAPYHIIENVHFAPQTKDSGYYPSIGLHPGILTAQQPCVVYIDNEKNIEYRYYDDFGGEWKGFTILSYSQTGLEPGPPSVYTYGDQVFVVFSVMNWAGAQQYNFISAVYFYQFTYNATSPGNSVTLDSVTTNALYESRPTIVVDGNGNPHCAWRKTVSGNEDIYYRWRNGSAWQSIERVSNQTPNYADKSPHIDCYGDWLSVVWYDEISGVPNEIWRRRRYLASVPPRWFPPQNYSLSPDIYSEFPVNAAHDFSVWCETGNLNDYDIRYRSDTYGFGWVSQEPEREYFCHSQLQRDWSPWDLYTIFTRGNTTPYQIVCVHQQFGGGPPGGESPLYVVEIGQDSLSPFCLHRDGRITYNNYSVDYANNELSYELSFLDPTFPFHKIKGTAYFEGTSNRNYELWINGVKKHSFVVRPNQAYNFEVLIPRELYQTNHRVILTIKNPSNTGVCLAGLSVYRKSAKAPGGPQSYSDEKLNNRNLLILQPNPFKQVLEIKLRSNSEIKKGIALTIYDISGRVVKKFKDLTQNQSVYWNAEDENGKPLPQGVYFLKLDIGDETITKKAVMLR